MFMRRGRMLPSTQRALIVLPVWLASVAWLWLWWFSDLNNANLFLFIPLSAAIFYEYTFIPGAFLYLLFKAKIPKRRTVFKNKKVAVITPCVPAQESLDVIQKQLIAMKAITYPHDSWILDEGNNKDVKKLARHYGVHYFSRKNIAKYNLSSYPFKEKTKAGNINAWLDRVRGRNYEFFVQMDIDHIPNPDYLDKTLGHFRDKKVAWVQAPSVYNNLDYWTARGSAEQELGLQGPIQMGFFGNTDTPIIIGSHTTFRMEAVNQINGFQPTRAEDHLNTLALVNKGWRGVYIPDVIATGGGPETLNAYLTQQYAWAFSMTQVFKSHSFKYLKNMPIKKSLQFLFLQTWYPASSISFLILFLVPVMGLLFNTYAVSGENIDFFYRFMPVFVSVLLVLWAGKPLSQPKALSISWRGILLHLVRWPIILMAISSAASGKAKPYQVTPKGKFLKNVPTTKLYRPFLFLGFVGAASVLFSTVHYSNLASDGLLIFATGSFVTMLSICLVDLNIRLRQVKLKQRAFRKYWLKPTGAVLVVMLLSATSLISAVYSNQEVIYALVDGETPVLTRDVSQLSPRALTEKEKTSELSSKKYTNNNKTTPKIGIYTTTAPIQSSKPYISHTFLDWREKYKLEEGLITAFRSDNTPLITIEPKGEKNGKKLLQGITKGSYDKTINDLLSTISLSDNTVYVRFAHEMELANLYAWGAQYPALYISAYRHVTELAKKQNITNIKWVWSPAGSYGAEAYYPGDDVVDVVGTTILYDRYFYGDYRPSFYEIAQNRQWLTMFKKPVWITELGIGNADPGFQKQLIKDALTNYKAMGFDALVYLNIPDSNLAGPDYRLANTSILLPPPTPKPVHISKLTIKPKIMKPSTARCDSLKQNQLANYKLLFPTDSSCYN